MSDSNIENLWTKLRSLGYQPGTFDSDKDQTRQSITMKDFVDLAFLGSSSNGAEQVSIPQKTDGSSFKNLSYEEFIQLTGPDKEKAIQYLRDVISQGHQNLVNNDNKEGYTDLMIAMGSLGDTGAYLDKEDKISASNISLKFGQALDFFQKYDAKTNIGLAANVVQTSLQNAGQLGVTDLNTVTDKLSAFILNNKTIIPANGSFANVALIYEKVMSTSKEHAQLAHLNKDGKWEFASDNDLKKFEDELRTNLTLRVALEHIHQGTTVNPANNNLPNYSPIADLAADTVKHLREARTTGNKIPDGQTQTGNAQFADLMAKIITYNDIMADRVGDRVKTLGTIYANDIDKVSLNSDEFKNHSVNVQVQIKGQMDAGSHVINPDLPSFGQSLAVKIKIQAPDASSNQPAVHNQQTPPADENTKKLLDQLQKPETIGGQIHVLNAETMGHYSDSPDRAGYNLALIYEKVMSTPGKENAELIHKNADGTFTVASSKDLYEFEQRLRTNKPLQDALITINGTPNTAIQLATETRILREEQDAVNTDPEYASKKAAFAANIAEFYSHYEEMNKRTTAAGINALNTAKHVKDKDTDYAANRTHYEAAINGQVTAGTLKNLPGLKHADESPVVKASKKEDPKTPPPPVEQKIDIYAMAQQLASPGFTTLTENFGVEIKINGVKKAGTNVNTTAYQTFEKQAPDWSKAQADLYQINKSQDNVEGASAVAYAQSTREAYEEHARVQLKGAAKGFNGVTMTSDETSTSYVQNYPKGRTSGQIIGS